MASAVPSPLRVHSASVVLALVSTIAVATMVATRSKPVLVAMTLGATASMASA